MVEDEIKGEESGRPQPVLPSSLNRLSGFYFFFKFKMDGQDVILDIQWLKNFLVRDRMRYPRIFLRLCLVLRKFEGKCKGKKIQRKNRRK